MICLASSSSVFGLGKAFQCSEYSSHTSLSLSQALMSLFVLASKDGWVDIMYNGLDAVGVDQQVNIFKVKDM